MPEAVVIRPATRTDLTGLVSLLGSISSLREEFAGRDGQRRDLELMLKNGRGRILIASVADGTVVGMCSGRLTIQKAEGGPAVLIEDVVVREDWRGQGLGELLIHRLTEWARADSAGRLMLLADPDAAPAPGLENNTHRPDNRL
ncbi:Acetyltransferase (GNAT) family protein [Pseudodesulfovibrio hydrargyri]|uniref:Acetyltransferase (GNAT) family protein n=1 Tax=Pseudodesulfovibrio hydrargyri TaxID=2125990 RepID=A0A1J5N234_9BACT|nr:GNAT family N-acetyltransferase [Pseudodesulfovibrio hydrargyri]OIQ52306.1 Acetyltransferase (GNAT) family protein [Pseudodesulfovibrio hydrargyri]